MVAPFPNPQWPPIQDFESIDIIGIRRDGGVELIIVATQPLDDSLETLNSIRKKVAGYLIAIFLEELRAEWGNPPLEAICIYIVCEHPIHPAAMVVIDESRALAAKKGVRLELRRGAPKSPTAACGENSRAASSGLHLSWFSGNWNSCRLALAS